MAEAGGGLRRRDKKARSDGRSGQQEAATDKRATGKPAATQKLSGAERSWSSDASGTKRVGTRAIMIGCGVVVYLWYTGSLFAAVKWAAIVFSGLLAMLFFKQNSMLYAPNPPQMAAAMAMMRELTPKVLSIEYEDAQIATADGLTLHGWFILQPAAVRSSVPTLVFFHGNAGSIVGRLKNFVELMVGLQCNVLAVDYRGYGRSEGKPTEAGLCEDARASLRYVGGRDDIDKSKVVVFGRSLGGAVALRLAADVEAGKVEGVAPCCYMIENSFTSVQEMASKLIWWVAPLLRMAPFFLRNKWESENAVSWQLLAALTSLVVFR